MMQYKKVFFVFIVQPNTINKLNHGERKKDFRVTGFMEVSNEDGTVYYANLENEKESLLLKSTSANSWNIYKRKHK